MPCLFQKLVFNNAVFEGRKNQPNKGLLKLHFQFETVPPSLL